MSHAQYLVGDVFDRMAELTDGSVDLVMTSPPFLALRSYLPADHPDKHKEIGSEPTPAAFLDTLLALTAEWRRLLAPHGSICVELGDTYAGSGGDAKLNTSQFREGYIAVGADGNPHGNEYRNASEPPQRNGGGPGWPLAKSLCAIPQLYEASLAYGRNLLTGTESPAGQWRVRNMVAWCRPNPPVGALGDKFRPATSYLTIACVSDRRYFDLDAVRTAQSEPDRVFRKEKDPEREDGWGRAGSDIQQNAAGAPPLDWWNIPTHPYPGAHYATFPPALCVKPVLAMCPQRVCVTCGEPSRRITQPTEWDHKSHPLERDGIHAGGLGTHGNRSATPLTLGWTDCGHGDQWRNGLVLDPFAGSGTTLAVATGHGRDAIGIDLDPRNALLAQERVGMFLETDASAGGPRP